MDYQNKVALVTGGSSGIGLALAQALSAKGAHVWIIARRQNQLEAALATIEKARQSPKQIFGEVAGDVSDWEQVSSAVDKVTQAAGVPDLLINSAGITHPGYFQDLDMSIFRSMMEVNYFGTVHAIKACLPGMLQRKSGYIVNISSVAGFLGVFGYTAYGASKFAVAGFSDVLRSEMKPYGIHLSIVYPPDVDTPQLAYENKIKPVETKAISGNSNVMTPEEVARTILKGVERGKYVILPGMEASLVYRLSGILGNGKYAILDYMIAHSRSGNSRSQQK
jgi:3-dehydrosphinganine reductase